jgi:hypothetical protein
VARVADREECGSWQEVAKVSPTPIKVCVFGTCGEARSNIPKGNRGVLLDDLHGCGDIERQ